MWFDRTEMCRICLKDVSPTALVCPHCGDDRAEHVAEHKRRQAYLRTPHGKKNQAKWRKINMWVYGTVAVLFLLSTALKQCSRG
ncbi:MAG: hypothetical protein ACON4Z_04860 [Planctomycetota bacterium]